MNDYITIICFALTVYTASTLTTLGLKKLAYKLNIIDVPNERSMHSSPIPRTGGLAIVLTFIITWCYLSPNLSPNLSKELSYLYYASALIAFISFADDCRNIAARYRLAIQIIAAVILIYSGLIVHLAFSPIIISYIFSFLFILWFTNLYNFMDGLDGFASGMTAIGYGTFAVILYLNNYQGLALINLVISLSALGVLTFNFPPAKIFLGDVGSATIGFFTAGMSILLHNQAIIPLWQSILIFSPFIVDATVTLIKRLLNKEQLLQPHRTHYYQKLALLIGKQKTLLLSYLLMFTCSTLAICINNTAFFAQSIILMYVAITYVILTSSIEFKLAKSKGPITT